MLTKDKHIYKLKYTILQSQMGGSNEQKNRAQKLHEQAVLIEPDITDILNNIIQTLKTKRLFALFQELQIFYIV